MKLEMPKLKIIKITFIFFLFIFVFLYILLKNPQTSTLKINEVAYKNDAGYDWLEIYNPSLQTRSLKGMYLTDDRLELEKYKIDNDVFIKPNGFVVIYGKNYETEDESVSKLNFNIKNGETLYLIENESLTIIDSLTVLSEESESSAGSVGRFPNGSENTFMFTISSMGESNIKDHIPGMNLGNKKNL